MPSLLPYFPSVAGTEVACDSPQIVTLPFLNKPGSLTPPAMSVESLRDGEWASRQCSVVLPPVPWSNPLYDSATQDVKDSRSNWSDKQTVFEDAVCLSGGKRIGYSKGEENGPFGNIQYPKVEFDSTFEGIEKNFDRQSSPDWDKKSIIRDTSLCTYRTGKCFRKRALKRDSRYHRLCEQHRDRANKYQKKLEEKKRIKNQTGNNDTGFSTDIQVAIESLLSL